MTQTDEPSIDDWSEASASLSWSEARTTEWQPKYSHPLRVPPQTPARHEEQIDVWLYAVCGVAALLLGIAFSHVLTPLIVGATSDSPDLFLQPEETPARSTRAAKAREPTISAENTRAMNKPARSRVPQPAVRSNARLAKPARSYETPAVTHDAASTTPDLDLMDAPSSAMELRALAEARAHRDTNYQRLVEQQRLHDPMHQLEVMQDPGVELGTLRINSRPWAQVFIDDKLVGTTPLLNVSVPAGEHNVRLVNNAFDMRKTFDVFVNSGESVSRVVALDD